MKKFNLGIFIFNDVEVLDFAGPYEVFSSARNDRGEKLFSVNTVSEKGQKIYARNGLQVLPDYSIMDCPKADILVIPGGNGRKKEMNNKIILGWIKDAFTDLEILLSVCTGAFIIGNAGLLKGINATTHHLSYDEFEKTFPDTKLIRDVKYVDNGKVITSAGISAGITASLYILDRLFSNETGKKTANHMEYDY